MKNLNFKNVSLIIGSVLIASVFFPVLASAQVITGANFCAKVEVYYTQYYTLAQQRLAVLENKIASSTTSVSSLRAQKDQNLATSRAIFDQKKLAQFSALQTLAINDAEKTAVATFESQINTAVANERTAVDSATKTYRNGIDVLISQKEPLIKAAAPTYKNAIYYALSKAKTDCSAGVNSANVFADTEAALRTAKAQFQTAVQYGGAINAQIISLTSVRNAAYNKAFSDLNTAMVNASNQLNAVFTAQVQ